jgi:transposase
MSTTRKSYPSDVSDAEWAFLIPYLTLMREDAPQREYALRDVFDPRPPPAPADESNRDPNVPDFDTSRLAVGVPFDRAVRYRIFGFGPLARIGTGATNNSKRSIGSE